MGWIADTYGLPHALTYNEAVHLEAEIKPIRGRSTPVKPLSRNRRKDYISIRKEGDNIVIQMYRTDILTLQPDGKMVVQKYTSLSTHAVLTQLLGRNVSSYKGETVIRCWFYPEYTPERGTVVEKVISGTLPMDELTVLQRIDGDLVNLNPMFPTKVRTNRKVANRIRKPYKPFIQWLKGYYKLRGPEDIVTDAEYDQWFTGEWERARHISWHNNYLAKPAMLADNPEDWVRVALLAVAGHRYDWNNSIRWPTMYAPFNPVRVAVNTINEFLLMGEPDAFYEEEIRSGELW
jgi:hypothetical protein